MTLLLSNLVFSKSLCENEADYSGSIQRLLLRVCNSLVTVFVRSVLLLSSPGAGLVVRDMTCCRFITRLDSLPTLRDAAGLCPINAPFCVLVLTCPLRPLHFFSFGLLRLLANLAITISFNACFPQALARTAAAYVLRQQGIYFLNVFKTLCWMTKYSLSGHLSSQPCWSCYCPVYLQDPVEGFWLNSKQTRIEHSCNTRSASGWLLATVSPKKKITHCSRNNQCLQRWPM